MPTLRLTGLHALVRLALVRLDACCKKRAGAVCREQRHILLVCARRGVIFWAQSSYQPSRLSGGRQWTKMSALITRRTARSWCAPSACRVTSSTSSAPATQALLLQATSARACWSRCSSLQGQQGQGQREPGAGGARRRPRAPRIACVWPRGQRKALATCAMLLITGAPLKTRSMAARRRTRPLRRRRGRPCAEDPRRCGGLEGCRPVQLAIASVRGRGEPLRHTARAALRLPQSTCWLPPLRFVHAAHSRAEGAARREHGCAFPRPSFRGELDTQAQNLIGHGELPLEQKRLQLHGQVPVRRLALKPEHRTCEILDRQDDMRGACQSKTN